MAKIKRPMTYSRLQQEVGQSHEMREPLYRTIENQLGADCKVVVFFTSFTWPVLLDDVDADMLEEVLHNSNIENRRLVLILNCAGGEALPAERIVNICRSFGSGDFNVIVPKMAKSAATMICFGASVIGMSRTSELGPIDPQIPVLDDEGHASRYFAAHEILNSYSELMRNANQTKGRIEPFLQQLARFDARDIERIKSAQKLSESIAVRCLLSGVFKGKSQRNIKQKIKIFLDPSHTKDHGRPIYHDVAKECGLPIKLWDVKSTFWKSVWELYVRLNYVVSSPATGIAKIIETTEDSYSAQAPRI